MKNKITHLLNLRKGLALIAALLGSSMTAIGFAAPPKQPKPDWSSADIPSQEARIVLVTGGTSGMGFEDAKALAAAGAQVIIAARNRQRGEETIAKITAAAPHAKVQFEALDLSDFSSVRALAKRLADSLPRLDVLINNAAIMAPPERGQNAEGVELQYATNYAGHFLLTAELLPLLRKSPSPRVVTVASVAVPRGRLNFEDLRVPLFVTALDLKSGAEVTLQEGSLLDAIIASSSVPGFFPPREVGPWLLSDAGLFNNMPIAVARALGAEQVIAVSLNNRVLPMTDFPTGIDVIFRNEEIGTKLVNDERKRSATLVIEPDISGRYWLDFRNCAEVVAAGEAAARARIDELMELARSSAA